MRVIKHYLAAYNPNTKTQKCVMCGEVIHDYSEGSYDSPEGANHKGWEPGHHYITGVNPTLFSSTEPVGKNVNIVICKLNYKNPNE